MLSYIYPYERQTHVAYLISLGFSPLEIGRRIGHSSEKITEQYSHLYPSQQLALIGKMDEDYNNSGKENHNVSERE